LGATECVRRRFGADDLVGQCHSNLEDSRRQVDSKGQTQRLIQQGQMVAFVWGAFTILDCIGLLGALCLAGWKHLKRCFACCCGISRIACSSAFLNKEEHKRHNCKSKSAPFILRILHWDAPTFFFEATALIAGLVAVVSMLRLWYIEFKCCIPRKLDEKQVSLLPEVIV